MEALRYEYSMDNASRGEPMSCSIEECKAFVQDAERARENWLSVANRSWAEIKKRQKNGKLWSVTPNSVRKRSRYPVWFSIWKIRQPLIFSRVGIPIGQDSSESGNDPVGATAAICIERLAINTAKSFDFYDVMCSARDDFLATNVGQVRAYYEREEIKEMVKKRLTPQQQGEDVIFIGEDGKIIESDDIGKDDIGYFQETDKVIDVENEKICLEPVLYTEFYVDPDSRRWRRVKRLAFSEYYSEPEFVQMFGRSALLAIPRNDHDPKVGEDEAYPKRRTIKVFEYWDYYEKEVKWFVENGTDFLTPLNYVMPEEFEDGEQPNGLYDLDGFFPCPAPCMINAATDEFWPTPEYYQLVEIFDDIHTLFSRMIAVTKAIRARLLFDNNVEGLQAALNEAAEGDAFGVSNLTQSLVAAGGSLENVVQYIPVEGLVNSLQQLYQALESRLNTVYKLTGTSDLLQGMVTDPTQRTFGERQMQEKYALNQIAEPQKRFQDFVRDCYQLMVEMAIKNFKDATLDRYIIPQTLEPEHQKNYRQALQMLKDDTKRFRVELETDSTIATNEDYDKQMRVELVNTLTAALEKTATISESNPALAVPELHALKFLIQGFRQGKLFQAEITEAIDTLIEQANQPKPEMPDPQMLQLEQNERLEMARIASTERIAMMEAQQDNQLAALKSQMEGLKIQSEAGQSNAELQLEYQKLSSDIAAAQQELALKRDELMVELRKIVDKKEVDQFQAMIDQSVVGFEQQLATAKQQLDQQKMMLDEREKYMTEARLQSEHELEKMAARLEMLSTIQQNSVQQQQAPVINVHVPEQKMPKVKRTSKIKRDPEGNIVGIEESDEQEVPV